MKIISNIILYMLLFSALLFTTGCVININEDEDCLRCSYKISGQEISQERCDPFYTESEKAEMRVRMQAEADSLGTNLDCVEH